MVRNAFLLTITAWIIMWSLWIKLYLYLAYMCMFIYTYKVRKSENLFLYIRIQKIKQSSLIIIQHICKYTKHIKSIV